MIRSFCVFVVALVCAVPLRAPASDDPLAGLDAAIESAREQWHAPGLAVAIVKDDQVVYLRGFGTKHLGRNDPVDAHTAFTLASTTKAFTAMALGLLVDDGKLRWDDPVVQHLPEFRVADPYVTREVTIRDLLVHRTGIEETDMLWVRGFDTRTSLEHLQYAKQAIAVNPESAAAYGVLSDALTELGRYDEGRAAARRMDDLQPSLASAGGAEERLLTTRTRIVCPYRNATIWLVSQPWPSGKTAHQCSVEG